MRVLVTQPVPETAAILLKAAGHDVTVLSATSPGKFLLPADLTVAAAGFDGMVTMLTDRIDAAFLAARPNIRAIANYAVGYNNIDVPACTAQKVGVSNTPGVLTDATAEIAWTLLMMAARRAGEGERLVRTKAWTGWEPLQLLGMDVAGRTLGIVGAGRIGARLARMARGFDMELLYHNRKASAEMEQLGATLVPLEELLKAGDFVSLHVPLAPETRHMIGAEQLRRMKPTSILINTARGPVVDEAALVEALKNGTIFAAGLDVYEREPAVHAGLFELENVVLLPHIGSATVSTRAKMAEMAAKNLMMMLAGKRPENPVNPDLWR